MLTNFIESKKVKSKLECKIQSKSQSLQFLHFFKQQRLEKKKNENVIENTNVNTKKTFFSRYIKKKN